MALDITHMMLSITTKNENPLIPAYWWDFLIKKLKKQSCEQTRAYEKSAPLDTRAKIA